MAILDPKDLSPDPSGGASVSAPSVTSWPDKPVAVPMTQEMKQWTETYKNKSEPDPTEGRKFDGGKLEYGLLPPKALQATVEVLTIGAEKYARDNWKYVDDSKRRYFDALQRHIWAWKMGEKFDHETGKHHLAHAMCCLMFLYEHDTIYSVDE